MAGDRCNKSTRIHTNHFRLRAHQFQLWVMIKYLPLNSYSGISMNPRHSREEVTDKIKDKETKARTSTQRCQFSSWITLIWIRNKHILQLIYHLATKIKTILITHRSSSLIRLKMLKIWEKRPRIEIHKRERLLPVTSSPTLCFLKLKRFHQWGIILAEV